MLKSVCLPINWRFISIWENSSTIENNNSEKIDVGVNITHQINNIDDTIKL